MSNVKQDGRRSVRIRIVVTGRVQGVGYRYFAVTEARRRNICGWVRNRFDGSVQVEAQGSSGAVANFISTLEVGPRYAVVSKVDTTEVPVVDDETAGFRVLHDA